MTKRVKLPTAALLIIGLRDKWTCQVCREGYIPEESWEVDHWTSLAKGGTNHLSNLRLTHRRCNIEKSSA